jgi:hypothetical protein
MNYIFYFLLVLILILIVTKLWKINEKFVSDFDDVLDYKCVVDTNNSYQDYNWNTGKCEKNICPLETCNKLVLDTRTNEYVYRTETTNMIGSYTEDREFVCSTKEDVVNNVYCTTESPTCYDLGASNFCFEYESSDSDVFKKDWFKKEYIKKLDSQGNCIWENINDSSDVNKTDDYFEDCMKEKFNCSSMNKACPTVSTDGVSIMDNYERYAIDENDDTGLTCKKISECSSCDTNATPIVRYRLNSIERVFESVLYTKKLHNNVCRYFDKDNKCLPNDDGEGDMSDGACSNNYTLDTYTTSLDCSLPDYRFCCNLDERDFFEYTPYRSVLSGDGTKCIYQSVNPRLSKQFDVNTLGGFNCPTYELQFCSNSNEYRNVDEQKCTPCPQGKFLSDHTQFTERNACSDLAVCGGSTVCYENINPTGNIKKKRTYNDEAYVERKIDVDDGSVTSSSLCRSTAPSDCEEDCSKPLVYSEIGDTYCDACPNNQALDLKTMQCRDVIDCPMTNPLTTKCLDDHNFKFYMYRKKQLNDDPFEPCLYTRENPVGLTYTMDSCKSVCPIGYVEDDDTNTCIIPPCVPVRVFESEVALGHTASTSTSDEDLFNSTDVTKFDLCKYNSITKKIKLTNTVPQTTPETILSCVFDRSTTDIMSYPELENVHSGIYKNNRIVFRYENIGGLGNCPVDCVLSDEASISPCVSYDNSLCSGRNENGSDMNLTGKTTYTYSVTTKQRGDGMSCLEALRHKPLNNTENSVYYEDINEVRTNVPGCPIPKCQVMCDFNYDNGCTNWEDSVDNKCVFSRECPITITTQSYGDNVLPCPASDSKKVQQCINTPGCTATCGDCEKGDIYYVQNTPTDPDSYTRTTVFNSVDWETLTTDTNNRKNNNLCEKKFRKDTKVTTASGNCFFLNTNSINTPGTNGDLIRTETKTGPDCICKTPSYIFSIVRKNLQGTTSTTLASSASIPITTFIGTTVISVTNSSNKTYSFTANQWNSPAPTSMPNILTSFDSSIINSRIQIVRTFYQKECGSEEVKDLTIRDDVCENSSYIFELLCDNQIISHDYRLRNFDATSTLGFQSKIPNSQDFYDVDRYVFTGKEWTQDNLPSIPTTFNSLIQFNSLVYIRRTSDPTRCESPSVIERQLNIIDSACGTPKYKFKILNGNRVLSESSPINQTYFVGNSPIVLGISPNTYSFTANDWNSQPSIMPNIFTSFHNTIIVNSTIRIERSFDPPRCNTSTSREFIDLNVIDSACLSPSYIFKMIEGTTELSKSSPITQIYFDENNPIILSNIIVPGNTPKRYSFTKNQWNSSQPNAMPELLTSFYTNNKTTTPLQIRIERSLDPPRCNTSITPPKILDNIIDDYCDNNAEYSYSLTMTMKQSLSTVIILGKSKILRTMFIENTKTTLTYEGSTNTYSFTANDWDNETMPHIVERTFHPKLVDSSYTVEITRDTSYPRDCNLPVETIQKTINVTKPIIKTATVYYDLTTLSQNPIKIPDISGNENHLERSFESGTHEVTIRKGIRMTNATSGFICSNIGNKAIKSSGNTKNVGWTTSMWLNVRAVYTNAGGFSFITGFATVPIENRAFSVLTTIDRGYPTYSIMGNDSQHIHSFSATQQNFFTHDTWFHLVVSIEKEPTGITYWRHYWNGNKTLEFKLPMTTTNSVKHFNIPSNSSYSLGYDYGERNGAGLRNKEIIIGSCGVFDRVLTDYEALELYNHQKDIYHPS